MDDSQKQYSQDSHPCVVPKSLLTDDIDEAMIPFSVGDVVNIAQYSIDPSCKKSGPSKETMVSLEYAAIDVNGASWDVIDKGGLLMVSVANPRKRCN